MSCKKKKKKLGENLWIFLRRGYDTRQIWIPGVSSGPESWALGLYCYQKRDEYQGQTGMVLFYSLQYLSIYNLYIGVSHLLPSILRTQKCTYMYTPGYLADPRISSNRVVETSTKIHVQTRQSIASRLLASALFSPSFSETRIPTRHSPRIPSQFTHGWISMKSLPESFPAPRSSSPFPPG